MTTKSAIPMRVMILGLLAACIVYSMMPQPGGPPRFSFKTFSERGAWGYDIMLNNKRVIHQETIPAQQNDVGFASETMAADAARMVIQKLRQGKSPTLNATDVGTIIHDDRLVTHAQ